MFDFEEENQDKKRSIGEVAQALDLQPHTIRFWEEKFPQIKPAVGKGDRRYYYNKQFELIKRVKKALYEEGYTIEGLQKILRKSKKEVQQMSFDDLLNVTAFSKVSGNLSDEKSAEIRKLTNKIEKNITIFKSLISEIK